MDAKLLETQNEWLGIAHVARAHGIKGAIVVVVDDRRESFGDYKTVLIETKLGKTQYKIERTFVSGNQPVLVLEGINSKNDAEKLLRGRIYVLRAEVAEPPMDDEEYLVADLIDCEVYCDEKGLLGKVVAVQNFGAQDNLEIESVNSKQTVYFPFIDPYVKSVDLDARRIFIVYIPEMFEIGKE